MARRRRSKHSPQTPDLPTSDPLYSVFALSRSFGPPRVDLRQANIEDDYGSELYSTHPIQHNNPLDVSVEDLEAYPRVFPFMHTQDLLFYLYPIVHHASAGHDLDAIESLLFMMETRYTETLNLLSETQKTTLHRALQSLQDASPSPEDPYIDMLFSPQLAAFLQA